MLDEKYSDIAVSKLQTIPTLRSFLTCGIYRTMVEIFLRLIPAFYLLSLFSLHPDRALSLAPRTYVQLLLQPGMLLDFILMITDQELSQPLSPTQNQFINMVFVEVLESPIA